MLTSAITAMITGVLSFFGVPPGPYIAGIWIGVKIVIVGIIALLGWRTAARAKAKASPSPTPTLEPQAPSGEVPASSRGPTAGG